MCEQCLTEAVIWPLFNNWVLFKAKKNGRLMKKGQWGITQSNDPQIIFDIDPCVDPTYDYDPEDDDDMFNEKEVPGEEKFWKTLELFRTQLQCIPSVGNQIVSDAMKYKAFNPEENNFEYWLLHLMGVIIHENPKGSIMNCAHSV